MAASLLNVARALKAQAANEAAKAACIGNTEHSLGHINPIFTPTTPPQGSVQGAATGKSTERAAARFFAKNKARDSTFRKRLYNDGHRAVVSYFEVCRDG